MAEIQYAKESTRGDFPLPNPRESPKRWCYDGKCLTTDFQIKKPRFVGLVYICGANPPTCTDFDQLLC